MGARRCAPRWYVGALVALLVVDAALLAWAADFYCIFCLGNPHDSWLVLRYTDEEPPNPVHLFGNESGALGELVDRLSAPSPGENLRLEARKEPAAQVSAAIIGRWEEEYGVSGSGQPLSVSFGERFYSVGWIIE